MRETQKCRKCGKTFSQIERTGPFLGGMGETMRHSEDKKCPHCGGSVIWIDENGSPLSACKRMEDANRHFRLGVLWAVIAILAYLAAYFLIKHGGRIWR